jgi:hypothetical protein
MAGVFEVALDGHIVRMLTDTPTEAAVRLGDELLLVGEGHVGRLSSRGGEVARVAVLSRPADLTCEAAGDGTLPLSVQTIGDVRVDALAGVVCVRLADRNMNMMDVAVDYRVTIADGRVESRVEWCGGVDAPGFDCGGARRTAAPLPSPSGFRMEGDAIVAPDGTRRSIVGEFHEELVSPSGRWVVLSGARQEADYIYRALLLLDRRDGAVHAIRVGDSSAPLTAGDLGDLTSLSRGLTAVGESVVRFVSWGGVERLVVDQFLVTPRGETVDLHGTPIF